MTAKEFQALLSAMLQSGEGVSDCLFLAGKPPLVERYGKLHELPMEEPGATLQPAHIDAMAALLMADSERLRNDLATTGSCDTSYSLGDLARFRVNIYRQNGPLRNRHAQIAIGHSDARVARVAAHFPADGARKNTASFSSPAAPAAARRPRWPRC